MSELDSLSRKVRMHAWSLWNESQKAGGVLSQQQRRNIESAMFEMENMLRADSDVRADRRRGMVERAA